jgi:transcriptional regulator with XRE-family HTH domain
MPTEIARLPKLTDDESQSTSSVREELLDNFKTGREYRHAFVEEKIRTSIAAQIRAIREQRGLTQPDFARELEKSQSWVSRLEDPNQPPPTVPSLLKVAEAFDVDLEIRFGRFSDLLRRLDAMTPESFEIPSFQEELASGAFEAAPKPLTVALNYLVAPSFSLTEVGKGQQHIDVKSANVLINYLWSWLRTVRLNEMTEARGPQRNIDEDPVSRQTMADRPFIVRALNPAHEPSRQAA